MVRWFNNIHDANAVRANMEVFFEVCYSMMYLNYDRHFALPPRL